MIELLLVVSVINTIILWGAARNVGRLVEHHKFLLEQESKNSIIPPAYTYRDGLLQDNAVSKDLKITHLS